MTVFSNQILETGSSFTVDGLDLSITSNGGSITNFTSEPFEGVWIGETNDTNAIYTLTFSRPITCLSFSLCATNSAETPVETFRAFSTSLDGGPAQAVEFSLTDADGMAANTRSVFTLPGIDQPSGGSGTINIVSAPFTSFSFRYIQSGINAGTVIEQVDAHPAADPHLTTAQVFRGQGELVFLATLATAAYKLAAEETTAPRVNDFNAAGAASYAAVDARIAYLSACDFVQVGHHDALELNDDGPRNFTRTGLENGIFTNRNAAALVGRSTDALFIAFRGTNDAAAATGGPLAGDTPDKSHWSPASGGGKPAHFALFADLIAAIRAYVDDADSGIRRIYVSGHSLGAGMVEALMDAWGANRVSAVAFASPGYGAPNPLSTDDRITNLWIDDDPILGASPFGDNEGDENTIYHNLEEGVNLTDGTTLHSMALYQAFVRFFRAEGITLAAFEEDYIPGVNYDSIHAHAVVVSEAALQFRIGAGADVIEGSGDDDIMLGGLRGDSLTGSRGEDLLLGGAGRDTLTGGNGRDHLIGGADRDTFVFNSVTETNSALGAATADLIRDFGTGGTEDVLDLREIDAQTGVLNFGNQAFVFIGADPFSNDKGELRAEVIGTQTVVTGDRNGDGIADFSIVLLGAHALEADNFLL